MDWFKKHVDMFVTVGVIFVMFTWMSMKFTKIDERFARIEKDLAVIKAVMILKNIMPTELAKKNKEERRK